jgi:hypothetical protein
MPERAYRVTLVPLPGGAPALATAKAERDRVMKSRSGRARFPAVRTDPGRYGLVHAGLVFSGREFAPFGRAGVPFPGVANSDARARVGTDRATSGFEYAPTNCAPGGPHGVHDAPPKEITHVRVTRRQLYVSRGGLVGPLEEDLGPTGGRYLATGSGSWGSSRSTRTLKPGSPEFRSLSASRIEPGRRPPWDRNSASSWAVLKRASAPESDRARNGCGKALSHDRDQPCFPEGTSTLSGPLTERGGD